MANEVLTRTPTSSGNRKKFTWAGWIKRNHIYGGSGNFYSGIFAVGTVDGAEDTLMFSDDQIRLRCETGTDIATSEKHGDPGNWIHVMMVVDTTLYDPDHRCIFYVNGVKNNKMSDEGDISQNANLRFNSIDKHYLGEFPRISNHLDGQLTDVFFVDGQALEPDVFGFYKDGDGYISSGTTQATDFRPGQWMPHSPTKIKKDVNRRGGFGVNGFYLPMNSSNNFGADFHTTPNTILKLKENLPQPKSEIDGEGNYTEALRDDPYKDNLVLAIPGVINGLGNGFGDYSADIRGSGTNKTVTANGSAGVTAYASHYGSAMSFPNGGSGGGDDGLRVTSSDFAFGTGDFTVEVWINPDSLYDHKTIFATRPNNSSHTDGFNMYIDASGNTGVYSNTFLTQASGGPIKSNQWTHVVAERHNGKLTTYINGAAAAVQSSNTQNYTRTVASIGLLAAANQESFTGQMQDLRVYKGIAKYKGGFDVNKPYTPEGIETWRAVPDNCKNNFATLNPLGTGADLTYSNGNLTCVHGSSTTRGPSIATIGVTQAGTEKYYWEYISTSTNTNNALTGIVGLGPDITDGKYAGYINQYGVGYYSANGETYTAYGGNLTFATYGASYTNGDVIGVALDMGTNNGTITFYKNGVSQGVAATGLGAYLTSGAIQAWVPGFGDGGSTSNVTHHVNFGQNPSFSGQTTAGTNADDSGKGLFKYAPPSGFLALCEDNLPAPAIADPGKHFKSVLYTGRGATGTDGYQSIRKVGFQPDLVWVKKRSTAGDHKLVDSVRGSGKVLESNTSDAEGDESNNFTGFNFDGFDLGANNAGAWNESTHRYVAWCWKAGGPAVTNTEGTITTQVSANPEAGFSIVKSDGPGVSGHGLNSTPKWIIQKSLTSGNWNVQHHSMMTTSTGKLLLNSSANIVSSSTKYMHAATATTFEPIFSGEQIAYVWAEVAGFSKFGKYTGNGNANGTFVYCGFKPAWLLIKRLDTSGYYWTIFDSSRKPTNPADHTLNPNLAHVEETTGGNGKIDLLSNGFKCRNADGGINGSGGFFIFVAFAESPFQTANAK